MKQKMLYYSFHGSWSLVWLFMTIFGSIMESQQSTNVHLVCDDEKECNKIVSKYNDNCNVCGYYSIAYKILSVLGGTLGLTQICVLVNNPLCDLIIRFVDFLNFIKKPLERLLFVFMFLPMVYVYQYLIYYVIFCHKNEDLCIEQPFYYKNIISNLYYTTVVISVIHLFSDIFGSVVFLYLFFKYRVTNWKTIHDIENALSVLNNNEIQENNMLLNKDLKFNSKSFFNKWRNLNEMDICEIQHEKSVKTIEYINNLKKDDTDSSNGISYNTFNDIMKNKNIIDSKQIWDCLFDDDDKTININSVENAFYNLFYEKKGLANNLYTDIFIVDNIIYFLLFLLYPAAFIAISRIFGYKNAFGTGVDLFKTYVLSISVITSQFFKMINFLTIMISNRPFNIGDVILFNNSLYDIEDISLSHTYLSGSYFVITPHESIINGTVKNLTKENISDSLEITFPVTVSNEEINEDVFLNIITDYCKEYPRDIKLSSLRLGWSSSNFESKIFKINWRYKFIIYNRSRVKDVKRNFCNFITKKISPIISEKIMLYKIAGGGGLNKQIHNEYVE